MILARLAKAIQQQNWFTVIIEILNSVVQILKSEMKENT